MNFLEKINNRFLRTNSHLCIGLDPDPQKIPEPFGKTPDQIFHFLEEVIEATSEYALALKPNLAYFEALGLEGIRLFEKVLKTIPEDIPIIADAKRGDIGPSSKKYAYALLEQFGCDAITVNPYMGYESIEPFLNYKDKGIFVLCLTSNSGANDFQVPNLYLQIAEKVREWNVHSNLGLVVGATHPERILAIREKSGPMPFLIPGIGAQGGALEKTLEAVQDGTRVPCLINASRSILYPEKSVVFNEFKETQEFSSKDCISSSRHAAHELHQKIRNCLEK